MKVPSRKPTRHEHSNAIEHRNPTNNRQEGSTAMNTELLGAQRLAELIREVSGIALDPEQLVAESEETYEELGVDSLARMELFTALEDIYGIDIPEEITSRMSNPAQTISLMNALTQAEAA